jgi:Domain of unknown function (DUF4388)
MAKARDTSTDRLSNVIEVVELGRRTGLLSAERGEGSYLEQGDIYFVGGRAIYAATAQLRGRDALVVLGQWGPCRFSFDTEAPRPAPNLALSPSPMGAPPDRGFSSSRIGTPSQGGNSGFAWGTPPSHPAFAPGNGSTPATPSRLPSADAWSMSQPSSVPATGPLGRRPRRSPDAQDLMAVVTSYNLSRSHRTLLLLADGSHNVLDLARLLSKTVDEVTQLLAELETRALVYYYE